MSTVSAFSETLPLCCLLPEEHAHRQEEGRKRNNREETVYYEVAFQRLVGGECHSKLHKLVRY